MFVNANGLKSATSSSSSDASSSILTCAPAERILLARAAYQCSTAAVGSYSDSLGDSNTIRRRSFRVSLFILARRFVLISFIVLNPRSASVDELALSLPDLSASEKLLYLELTETQDMVACKFLQWQTWHWTRRGNENEELWWTSKNHHIICVVYVWCNE